MRISRASAPFTLQIITFSFPAAAVSPCYAAVGENRTIRSGSVLGDQSLACLKRLRIDLRRAGGMRFTSFLIRSATAPDRALSSAASATKRA